MTTFWNICKVLVAILAALSFILLSMHPYVLFIVSIIGAVSMLIMMKYSGSFVCCAGGSSGDIGELIAGLFLMIIVGALGGIGMLTYKALSSDTYLTRKNKNLLKLSLTTKDWLYSILVGAIAGASIASLWAFVPEAAVSWIPFLAPIITYFSPLITFSIITGVAALVCTTIMLIYKKARIENSQFKTILKEAKHYKKSLLKNLNVENSEVNNMIVSLTKVINICDSIKTKSASNMVNLASSDFSENRITTSASNMVNLASSDFSENRITTSARNILNQASKLLERSKASSSQNTSHLHERLI